MIYRPVRERSVDYLKTVADNMLSSTGYDEISLSSLSSSDYSKLPELVYYLIDNYGTKGVNISLPSLRIDAFALDVMNRVQDVKKSSLTFAPEAGSQRMRNVINKGLTEDNILEGAMSAFKCGWDKVKLYFMLGLPEETDEDIKEIAVLSDKIAREYYTIPKTERKGKVAITTSTSFFVPKPFTPFQWAPMVSSEEFLRKQGVLHSEIKAQLNAKSIKYNWHDPELTVLEGLLARGDRRLSKLLEEVYKAGCIFDAWTDHFHMDKWNEAIEKTGTDVEFYTSRIREDDELFPWDFIDAGVTKSFLLREYKRSLKGDVTPNCRMKCSGCGAGSFEAGICVLPR